MSNTVLSAFVPIAASNAVETFLFACIASATSFKVSKVSGAPPIKSAIFWSVYPVACRYEASKAFCCAVLTGLFTSAVLSTFSRPTCAFVTLCGFTLSVTWFARLFLFVSSAAFARLFSSNNSCFKNTSLFNSFPLISFSSSAVNKSSLSVL